jgi:hypothetical protein
MLFLPDVRFPFAVRGSFEKIGFSSSPDRLALLPINGAGFEIAAAIADHEFDIAAVHIQAKTIRPGFADKGTYFYPDFVHRNQQSPQFKCLFKRPRPGGAEVWARNTVWQ